MATQLGKPATKEKAHRLSSEGERLLVGQVLICDKNKPQIHSYHIKIHQKNLYLMSKASPVLN